jgi:CRP-like cAMP-binding protein
MSSSQRRTFWSLLDEEHRELVRSASTEQRFHRGDIIVQEGAAARFVLILRSGRVKVVASTHSGYETVLAVRGSGDIIGEMGVVDDQPRSASVLCLDTVHVLSTPSAAFTRLRRTYPQFANALLAVVTARLRLADARFTEHGDARVAVRLAALLINLVVDHGVPGPGGVIIAMRLSQSDLAGLIGASREAVVLALRSLRTDGVLSTGRQRLTIHHMAALRALLDERAG